MVFSEKNLDTAESSKKVPVDHEIKLTDDDKELIEELYKDTDFKEKDFKSLKFFTGKKFAETLNDYGRKLKKDGTWDEGVISKDDLQELDDYVDQVKSHNKKTINQFVAMYHAKSVEQYGEALKLIDEGELSRVEVEEKETTVYTPDGSGLDKEKLQQHPKVQEYVLGFRSLMREELQKIMKHSEAINEALTDRHLDNLSLSLLDNVIDQLNVHWGDIESTMDSIIAQMPRMIRIMKKNQSLLTNQNLQNPQKLRNGMNKDDVAALESIMGNFEVSPGLQSMITHFTEAPGKVMKYVQDRVDQHLAENNIDKDTASPEELTLAYKNACKVFSQYDQSEAFMEALFTGKDISAIGFTEGKEESLPEDELLSGLEGKITAMEPKIKAMKDRLEKEGGLMGFLNNEETMGKLNKFAQFMSGGKHTNFMSWFKETGIGKLLLGGMQLFEIFTGKETGFDFEETENKQIVKFASDLYIENDKKKENTELEKIDLTLGDYTENIMYLKEVDGEKQPVYTGSARQDELSTLQLEESQMNTLKDNTGGEYLEEIIRKDINVSLLGSIVHTHVMKKDDYDFHAAVYGEAAEGVPATPKDLLKSYMENHFSDALGAYVKGKTKPTMSEETIVTIIMDDLLQKKKAYDDLDVSVKGANGVHKEQYNDTPLKDKVVPPKKNDDPDKNE